MLLNTLGVTEIRQPEIQTDTADSSHSTFRRSDYCWKVEKVVGTKHWSNSSWS